ncbi:transposase [Hyphobacterium sp. CCMP332]|nr:transposase [Hyphobacterium sp. CCMP332]
MTFTVVKWVDLFTRPEYKDVIIDALNFCIKNKGLNVYAWVLMSNHLHLIADCSKPFILSNFIRDFKRHTSITISKLIIDLPESRREWMLEIFNKEALRSGRAKHFKLWKDDNHAIWLGDIDIWGKVNYIHQNPVNAQIVQSSEQYLYSSARDYNGLESLVEIRKLD